MAKKLNEIFSQTGVREIIRVKPNAPPFIGKINNDNSNNLS
jgi:hypothetical protein